MGGKSVGGKNIFHNKYNMAPRHTFLLWFLPLLPSNLKFIFTNRADSKLTNASTLARFMKNYKRTQKTLTRSAILNYRRAMHVGVENAHARILGDDCWPFPDRHFVSFHVKLYFSWLQRDFSWYSSQDPLLGCQQSTPSKLCVESSVFLFILSIDTSLVAKHWQRWPRRQIDESSLRHSLITALIRFKKGKRCENARSLSKSNNTRTRKLQNANRGYGIILEYSRSKMIGYQEVSFS